MSRFVAWSNLAYLAAGLLSGDPFVLAVLSTLGVCSYLYHSKRVPWGGFADVAAMYATFSGLLLMTWGPFSQLFWPAITLIGMFFMTFHSKWWQAHTEWKVPVLWALWVGSIALHHPDWRLYVAGIACFALGGVLWIVDERSGHRYEKWRHGVWHGLSAVGILLLVWA